MKDSSKPAQPPRPEISLTIEHTKSFASAPPIARDASILVRVERDAIVLDLPDGYCAVNDVVKLALHVKLEGSTHDIEILAKVSQLSQDQLNTDRSCVQLELSSMPELYAALVLAVEERQKQLEEIVGKLKV